MMYPILRYGRRLRQRERASLEADAELTQSFHQALSGIRQVKTFGAEALEKTRFSEEAAAYQACKDKVIQTESRNTGLSEAVWGVAGGGMLALAGAALYFHWATMEQVVVFGAVMVALYQPIRTVTKGFIVLQEAVAGLERVLELCEPGPMVPDAPNAHPLAAFNHDRLRATPRARRSRARSRGRTPARAGPAGARSDPAGRPRRR